MRFYHSSNQELLHNFFLLPQRAAPPVDARHRTLNSWAIRRKAHSLLIDAPFVWVLDGVARLTDKGVPPWALVLTCDGVASCANALVDIAEGYSSPVYLNGPGQDHAEAVDASNLAGITYRKPLGDPFFERDGLTILPMTERAKSAALVWCETEGVLITGDSSVGAGPHDEAGRWEIRRPACDPGFDDEALRDRWRELVTVLDPAAILPLRGAPLVRGKEDRSVFRKRMAYLWEGAPDQDTLKIVAPDP